MGIFSGIGSIIGGAGGLDAEAPEILDEFKPSDVFGGLRAGGLRFKMDSSGRLTVARGPGAKRSRKQLQGIFRSARKTKPNLKRTRRQLGKASRLASDVTGNLRALRGQVRPGFGRLTQARVKAIERAEGRALGNLREQFGARNVLGSSFAAREEAGLVAEFGEREEEARAQAIIEEIGTTLGIDRELLNVAAERRAIAGERRQNQALRLATKFQSINTRLEAVKTRITADMAEAGLAANIQAQMLGIAERIARAQAGLEAQAAADRGAALGAIFGGVDQIVGGGTLFGDKPIFGSNTPQVT